MRLVQLFIYTSYVAFLIPVVVLVIAVQLGISIVQMVLSPLFGAGAPSRGHRTGSRSYVVMRGGRSRLYNIFRY